jgi:hypothetical protein
MKTKHTKGEWIQKGPFLYMLHEKKHGKFKGELSNKFHCRIYPDYGDGMEDEDAEIQAKKFAAADELLSLHFLDGCTETNSVDLIRRAASILDFHANSRGAVSVIAKELYDFSNKIEQAIKKATV